jgi:small redox-active disulfide protein 2
MGCRPAVRQPDQNKSTRGGVNVEVKVLGSGCANCKRLETVAREALAEMGLESTVSKVTAFDDIMAYDIVSTPGLVINEKVVSSGRVPSKAEITSMIATALSETGA